MYPYYTSFCLKNKVHWNKFNLNFPENLSKNQNFQKTIIFHSNNIHTTALSLTQDQTIRSGSGG